MRNKMIMSFLNFSIYNTFHLLVFAYLIQSSSTNGQNALTSCILKPSVPICIPCSQVKRRTEKKNQEKTKRTQRKKAWHDITWRKITKTRRNSPGLVLWDIWQTWWNIDQHTNINEEIRIPVEI